MLTSFTLLFTYIFSSFARRLIATHFNRIETTTQQQACAPNMFHCENGPCISSALHCNGVNDCPYDTSDELDCEHIITNEIDSKLSLTTFLKNGKRLLVALKFYLRISTSSSLN